MYFYVANKISRINNGIREAQKNDENNDFTVYIFINSRLSTFLGSGISNYYIS